LYSVDDLNNRFDDLLPQTDEHFSTVVYQNDKWYYDNNSKLLEFVPHDTDILVAAVDFTTNTVTDLKGYGSTFHGISLGYKEANLAFHAEQFYGAYNPGEFEVTGNWLVGSEDRFVFKTADTFVSRTTLPDGALGSTTGKGWTSTGLFHDNGTFWSGNDGRMNNKDSTYDPSVIRMDMDGTTILEQIDVHALEQQAGVDWGIRTIQGVIVDNNGDLWVASSNSHKIFKISAIELENGETEYQLNPEELIVHQGANGLAFNPDTNEMMTYSVSNGYVTVFDISDGSATMTRSFAIGRGGDQMFYQAETGHLMASFGGNGKPGYIRIFDAETGARIGQSSTFAEVTAVEGISIVDNRLYFQSDAYFHPEGPVDLNQLIVYDLDPYVNETNYMETDALNDYWF